MNIEDRMRKALDGHLWSLRWTDHGPKLIDLLDENEEERAAPVPWTDDELRVLADMKRAGASLSEISDALDRSIDSIIHKWTARAEWKGRVALPPVQDMTTLDDILRAVCGVYGTTRDVLISPSRMKRVTEARHVAAWLARAFTARSFPALGAVLNRDHATIQYGVRKVDANLDYYRHEIELCLFDLGLELVTREAA